MNMFRREMKSNRTSLILWCIGILFMVGVGMGKYTLSNTGISLNDVMADMPKSLQAIMGTNSLDLSSAIGYYGLLYLYLVVMATIHASMLGANIISKEERDKTVEFLLVKPISRSTNDYIEVHGCLYKYSHLEWDYFCFFDCNGAKVCGR